MNYRMLFPLAALLGVTAAVEAGEFPRALEAFPGKTPTLDGVISPGEWDDATKFTGVADWIPQFSRTTDARDLSLRGWVKHDAEYKAKNPDRVPGTAP